MKLNLKKTKVMVMEKQPGTEIILKSNGVALEQVNKYKYLSTLSTEDMTIEKRLLSTHFHC